MISDETLRDVMREDKSVRIEFRDGALDGKQLTLAGTEGCPVGADPGLPDEFVATWRAVTEGENQRPAVRAIYQREKFWMLSLEWIASRIVLYREEPAALADELPTPTKRK